MKFLKTFESHVQTQMISKLEADAIMCKYYDAIKMLSPQYLKDVKLVDNYDNINVIINFKSTEPITEGEVSDRDKHLIGKYWSYGLGRFGGDNIEIMCDDTEDSSDVNNIYEFLQYALSPSKATLMNACKFLLENDPTLKILFPSDVLKELDIKQIASLKDVGILENKTVEELYSPTYEELSEKLKDCYNILTMLPQYYFKIKVIRTDLHSDPSIDFYCRSSKENYELFEEDDELYIVTDEHSFVLDSLNEIFGYTIRVTKKRNEDRRAIIIDNIWKSLIEKDASFKLKCPVEILKRLKFNNIAKFNSIGLNESVNPYFGYYDYCNDNIEELNKELEKNGIEFTYDPYSNVTVIYSETGADAYQIMSSMFSVDKQYSLEDIDSDCVHILPKNKKLTVPSGAFL